MDRLRDLQERAEEERRLAVESRKRGHERTRLVQAQAKLQRRAESDAARHPTRRAVTAAEARQGLDEAGADFVSGGGGSKTKNKKNGKATTKGKGNKARDGLQTLLREAHRDATGEELRLSTTRLSGGFVARAFTLTRKPDGTLDLAGETELGSEQGSSKDATTGMLCYLLLQKLYPDALVAAVEDDPELLDQIL